MVRLDFGWVTEPSNWWEWMRSWFRRRGLVLIEVLVGGVVVAPAVYGFTVLSSDGDTSEVAVPLAFPTTERQDCPFEGKWVAAREASPVPYSRRRTKRGCGRSVLAREVR